MNPARVARPSSGDRISVVCGEYDKSRCDSGCTAYVLTSLRASWPSGGHHPCQYCLGGWNHGNAVIAVPPQVAVQLLPLQPDTPPDHGPYHLVEHHVTLVVEQVLRLYHGQARFLAHLAAGGLYDGLAPFYPAAGQTVAACAQLLHQ